MATSTVPSQAAATPEAAPHPYADLVEDHVRRTQGYLRSCDIAGAVITIVVFLLGYLMAMALVDHWIWTGGLGRGGRALACLTMLVLVGVYAWRTLLPHLLHRINPVYAADRLERAQPSLMNSLVNLLMLRSQERHISDAVMRGLERQAATGIEHLPAEVAVDRRKLLRTAYVLVGVLLFCALYVVFSPKSPLISAARILIPWADIPAVTRVRIEKVRPGSEDVYRGEPVTVTAEVRGLRDDEPVTLRYASVDGQTDNQSVAMFRREGQTAHSCQLPPDTAGMQRDLEYQIEAGDTKSAQFRLHVVPAPTIQIESIEYRYPPYTGMPPLTVERLGDIKGLEGTQVVIRAKSSQPIGTASLQLSGIRDTTLPMQTRGELAARVELPLKLVNVQGGRDPQYTSYKLDVTNAKGNHNREPASYRIEVTPDLPPQVDVFEPRERDIQLPADKELSIEVRARDADFALSDVRLLATRKGERLLDESLVKDRKLRLDQPVRTAYRFVPGRHGLKAGDEVLFRVAAIDNKRPQPNRQLTPEYRIAVVAPETPPMQQREPNQQDNMQREGTPQQQEEQVAAGKSPKGEQGKAGEKQSSPSKSEKGEKGEKSAKSEKGEKGEKGDGNESGSGSESQGSEGSEQQKDGASKRKDEGDGAGSDSASASSDPIDDGEAVQRIVKHLEQQGQKPEDQQKSSDSSGSKSGDESQVASADKQDSKQDNKQDSKQKDSQAPDKGDSTNPPKDDQQGSQQQDSKDQGGSSSGEKSSDEKQGEKQGGDKSGQKQDGQQQDGQQQGSQKSQSGQQGQSQSGGGGKSQQQGAQSGSQGNSSGQSQQSSSQQSSSQQSSSEKSSGEQQGSSKEGTSSSSAQGQKGSNSSDSKQPSSGDRQTQQAQNNPSNKSSSGAGQADSKQQGSRPGDQTAQKQAGESTPNQQTKGQQTEGGKKPVDQVASNDPAQKQDGQKQDGQKQDGQKQDGQKQDGQKQDGQKQDGQKQSGTEKSGEGQSTELQKGEKSDSGKTQGMNPGQRDPQSQKPSEATDGGKPQSGGAQGRQQEDGSSGEGNRPDDKVKDIAQKSGESSDNRASGDAKDKPQDKARAPGKTPAKGQQAASDSKTSEEDSKAPEKQRPSDTGSDQGGERAGKGQEGMGQASSGAGGGSAGKNQAADDGGSRSQQSGPGDQSNRAGNQQQTDRTTGKAGQQAGDARSGRPENDKRKSGDSQRRPEDGQPSEPNPEAPQGMQPGQGQQVAGQPAEPASGSGGDPAAGKSGPSSSKPSGTVVPGSEQANLEYSKRATDLTLTYLQDQLAKGHIDDGLRKRLGWSEEEFQSLLKRMQSMRDRGADAAAKPEDKQAYEQWLKSLGLRPSTGAVRTGKVESKPLTNSRDDAPVSVPRDLREQHEAFRQGLLEKSR